MALVRFNGTSTDIPLEWARTRVTASVIAGTVLLDSTDYTTATGASRAEQLLTNPAIDSLAAKGRAFRPLDGDVGYVRAPVSASGTATNSGAAAADTFVLADGIDLYLATFNLDAGKTVDRTIDLARAGLSPAATYRSTDLWSGATRTVVGALALRLGPGQAALVRLRPE
jgi:hypothetical protein